MLLRGGKIFMPGKIKHIIDKIIAEKSKGSDLIKLTLKTKFVLKGVDPDNYTELSQDDPAVIEKLKEIARDFNVHIEDF